MTEGPRRQGAGRKASNDPTFHPSRDEAHWAGDETSTGQGVLFDQGEHPARMNLFGGNEAKGNAGNTSRLHPTPGDARLEGSIEDMGSRSRVPTAHWGRRSGKPIDVQQTPKDSISSGYYQHPNPAFPAVKPIIGITSSYGGGMMTAETLLHEMGHAHHYSQTTKDERTNLYKSYNDRRGSQPDPLREAVADAYVDRYGGDVSAHNRIKEQNRRNTEFTEKNDLPPMEEPHPYAHISDRQFGYSSEYEATEEKPVWDEGDRALYAGTRAHFGETGEIPRYQKNPEGLRHTVQRASTDATISMLNTHSPHAREAWKHLGMEAGVEQATRRHRDRRLIAQGQEIQESLFGDPEHAVNQFGEKPRSVEDVKQSLGLHQTESGGNEFHSFRKLNMRLGALDGGHWKHTTGETA